MNQKQALTQIVKSFRHQMVKYAFISEWLQDINWHTENSMWYDRPMTKLYVEQEEKAQRLHLIQKRDMYLPAHWAHIKETYKITEQDFEDLKTVLHGDTIMLWESSTHIDIDTLNDYARMQSAYSVLNHIYGWGLDESFEHHSGTELLDELEAIIKQED